MSNTIKIKKKKSKTVSHPVDNFLEKSYRSPQTLLSHHNESPKDPDVIGLYLDDERPCPEGWTLARTHRDFFDLLKQGPEFLNKVQYISLDWYLGHDDISGVEVAQKLAERFLDDPQYLPNLKAIGCHSSDRNRAQQMSLILAEALDDANRYPDVRVRFGTPDLRR